MLTLSKQEQDAKYASLVQSKRWQGPNIPAICILSAWTGIDDHSYNAERHKRLDHVLKMFGYPHKSVIGQYKGSVEASFLVVLSSEIHEQAEQIEELLSIAKDFEQESVLVSDRYRMCKLLYTDGDSAEIGQLREVSRKQASELDNWTYCPKMDTFFSTSPL